MLTFYYNRGFRYFQSTQDSFPYFPCKLDTLTFHLKEVSSQSEVWRALGNFLKSGARPRIGGHKGYQSTGISIFQPKIWSKNFLSVRIALKPSPIDQEWNFTHFKSCGTFSDSILAPRYSIFHFGEPHYLARLCLPVNSKAGPKRDVPKNKNCCILKLKRYQKKFRSTRNV